MLLRAVLRCSSSGAASGYVLPFWAAGFCLCCYGVVFALLHTRVCSGPKTAHLVSHTTSLRWIRASEGMETLLPGTWLSLSNFPTCMANNAQKPSKVDRAITPGSVRYRIASSLALARQVPVAAQDEQPNKKTGGEAAARRASQATKKRPFV